MRNIPSYMFFSRYFLQCVCVVVIACSIAITGCTPQRDEDQSLQKGDAALAKLETADAAMYFELYLRKNATGSKRWYAWNQLLDITLNYRHEKNTARSYLEIMSKEYAADPEKMRFINRQLALIAAEQHDDAKAIALWEELLTDASIEIELQAEILRKLSAAYLRRLDFTLATETLERCLTLTVGPNTKAACLYDLAVTQTLTEEMPQAEATLRNLLALPNIAQDKQVLATYTLADVLEQQNKFQEAFALFESIRTSYPNEKVIELRLSNLKPKIK